MLNNELVHLFFKSDSSELVQSEQVSIVEWKKQIPPRMKAWSEPLDRAMAGGFMADRLAFAFLAAYQSALQKQFPFLNPEQLAAFCVSEQGGSKPKAMQTRIEPFEQGFQLSGSKTFVTGAEQAEILLVAARDTTQDLERPRIRIAVIQATNKGVRIEEDKVMPFMSELQKGRLHLDQCYCSVESVLVGDGYAEHVKPFSPLEAFFVMAAGLCYLLRLARLYDWPASFIEQCLLLLHAVQSADYANPESPTNQLLLNGLRVQLKALVEQTEHSEYWRLSDEQVYKRWLRDKAVLMFSDRSHTIRLERAWSQLKAS